MIVRRIHMGYLLFSTLLVGCQEPFINIDIKTGGGTGYGGIDSGCRWWVTVCPGQKDESKVISIKPIAGDETIKLYTLRTDQGEVEIRVPPSVVDKNIKKDDLVDVTSNKDGTYLINLK